MLLCAHYPEGPTDLTGPLAGMTGPAHLPLRFLARASRMPRLTSPCAPVPSCLDPHAAAQLCPPPAHGLPPAHAPRPLPLSHADVSSCYVDTPLTRILSCRHLTPMLLSTRPQPHSPSFFFTNTCPRARPRASPFNWPTCRLYRLLPLVSVFCILLLVPVGSAGIIGPMTSIYNQSNLFSERICTLTASFAIYGNPDDTQV
jgi:hypothetical protein